MIPKIKFSPPIYCAKKTKLKYEKSGDNTGFWNQAKYSKPFGELKTCKIPKNKTLFKMLWDDYTIYLKAVLFGKNIYATKTIRDDVIFLDNNFEAFFDFFMTTENYLEIEINALNTIWDLILTRPYRDNGEGISTFDIKDIFTKVNINGILNQYDKDNNSWECEIIIPFKSIKKIAPYDILKKGIYFRANFARTDWPLKYTNNKYQKIKGKSETYYSWSDIGIKNLHYPEMWGYIYLGDNDFKIPDKELEKFELRKLYYMQHLIYKKTNSFTNDLKLLKNNLNDYPNLLPLKNLDYKIIVGNNSFIIKTKNYEINNLGVIK